MEKHEMAEKLVEKCGITYEEAGEVLKESGFDLLEAMIILERRGKLGAGSTNKYSTYSVSKNAFVYDEKTAADAESLKEFISLAAKKICTAAREILRYQVVISKDNAEILNFPLLLAIILLCCTAGLAFVATIITLFNGCSYSIRKIM